MDSKIVFGTGGLRAVMGDGDGFINHHVIQRVTHGLAKVILSSDAPKSVGVAFDTRHRSAEFAETVCETFSAFGIDIYRFEKPMPTPVLSHAIRIKSLGWGVCITASHNPREYNGYKVYDLNGVQVTDKIAGEIADFINSLGEDENIPKKQSNLIRVFENPVIDEYFRQIIDFIGIEREKSDYPFVYSALYGAGANAVPYVLEKLGFSPVCVQQEPDGDFGGLNTPNPEEPVVYDRILEEVKICQGDGSPDTVTGEPSPCQLILATDPDCDRIGVMVKKEQGFKLLSGNQVGALLINYLAGQVREQQDRRTVTLSSVVISTIVSGMLGEFIAKDYGFEFIRLLTGFKYIGEYITNLPVDKQFFFGYEESYGFLAGDGARDKDAVIASALIVKMAAYYDTKGITLFDRWHELSKKHGYCLESLHSFTVSQSKQKELMTDLRNGKINCEAMKIEDYINGLYGLPPADVIKLYFGASDTGTDYKGWAAIRPSGTEPKLKVYVGVCNKTYEGAKEALETLSEKILKKLGMTEVMV
ncbi:MAG: phospho-sugar mutase [Oscillospiraceae bacterium]|nr:phospho-sugar mutase [Oscillospiraceae bacterium]